MSEDAVDERLVEFAFADGDFTGLNGWEVEGQGKETGEEVCVGDAGEGGENEE